MACNASGLQNCYQQRVTINSPLFNQLFLTYGEFYHECGSLALLTFNVYVSTVFCHYAVTDAQTQPNAQAYFFGGEKGVEYLPKVFGWYAGTIIGK
jgi:hypothetical protein